MVTLAVGTDAGFFLLDETNGTWTIKAEHLDGCEVLGVDREPGGTVLAASRGQGLNRIDGKTGVIERLAIHDLPEMLHAVTVSPHDANTIYVGSEPAGLYVSHDRGLHFKSIDSVARLNRELGWTYPIPSMATHIRHVVVDADNPNRLYAAVQVGGFITSNDAGETWTVDDKALDPDVHAILQHPSQPDLIYAVCGGGGGEAIDPEHKSGRPIYRSTDRGQNWRCVSGDFSRTYGAPVGVVPGPNPVLLAGIARDIPPRWRKRPERADSAVVISKDNGDTWQTATADLGNYPKMFEAVAVGPANEVFIGTGIDVGAAKDADPLMAEIYYAAGAEGPWKLMPLKFPGIAVMTCV
jgi:hypothetical protein